MWIKELTREQAEKIVRDCYINDSKKFTYLLDLFKRVRHNEQTCKNRYEVIVPDYYTMQSRDKNNHLNIPFTSKIKILAIHDGCIITPSYKNKSMDLTDSYKRKDITPLAILVRLCEGEISLILSDILIDPFKGLFFIPLFC